MENGNNNNSNNSNGEGDKLTNVSGLINNMQDIVINDENKNNNPENKNNPTNENNPNNQNNTNENKSSSNNEKPSTTEIKEVEIDGKVFKLNEKGDAVDNEGKTVMTKAEIEKAAEDTNDDTKPLIDELIEKTGYVIKDDNGEPKKYEDSIEGIQEYAEDVAEEKAYEKVSNWFKERPEIEKYAQFLERGGKPEDFFQRKIDSVKNIKFDEKDSNLLKSLITRDLLNSGMSKEQADLTAQMYEDTNKLKDFGKLAFDKLKNYEEQLEIKEKQEYEKSLKLEEEKIKNHWNNINTIISKGQLANITIPDADRKGFFEWLALGVDDNGNSQASIARSKATTEQLLQLDYLLYKGFDLSKLIQQKANQEKVNNLRLRIHNKGGLSNGEGVDKSKYTNPNDINISLENITKNGN